MSNNAKFTITDSTIDQLSMHNNAVCALNNVGLDRVAAGQIDVHDSCVLTLDLASSANIPSSSVIVDGNGKVVRN